jgi:hypothetical protein
VKKGKTGFVNPAALPDQSRRQSRSFLHDVKPVCPAAALLET